MVTDGFELFTLLAGIAGLMFWLSSRPEFSKFFSILPPIVWIYLLPSVLSIAGVIPGSHATYDIMTYYLLPFALFLLTITVDVKAILKLGKLALGMMAVGTLGIAIGIWVAFVTFQNALPADGWQSMAALSGTWIGGTANMAAVQQSLLADESILGPIIIIDSVVGYGWMAILIILARWQLKFDKWNGADRSAIDTLEENMKSYEDRRMPTTLAMLAMITGLGLVVSVVVRNLSADMPVLGDPVIISGTTWAMLMVVTGGLILSFTRVRDLEFSGASTIGYYGLYLMVAAIGAQANISGLLEYPAFFLAGLLVLVIHVGLLFFAAKLFRAPMFLVATGSMANIGGALSAPIVAGIYSRGLAPVGVLMAIAGYILGVYAPLGIAKVLSILAGF